MRRIVVSGWMCMIASALSLATACTASEPHPPTALEGTSSGATPCERSGYRCAVGICLAGTVSTGGSLGCAGEGALCCQPTPDGGSDAAADAPAPGPDGSADDASADSGPDAGDAALD